MKEEIKKNKSLLNADYYKAYEKRYQQVYDYNFLWSSKEPSQDIINVIKKESISLTSSILEIGCGEGRDAIFLLNNGYNVLATDYSQTVIEKCNELTNNKYKNNFKQLDILNDKTDDKYDFIYSISVIHMFVYKRHRKQFYKFIYNHLKDKGIALITSMGDGIKTFESKANKAFDSVERLVINNNKKIKVAATSCKIVDWNYFESELLENNLIIKEKWISSEIPEFNPSMCVLVCKKEG